MIFGPEGQQEVTEYSEKEYYSALRAIENYVDADYNSVVIDHARSIMHGKVPDKVLKEHPYETLSLLKDSAISRVSYMLEQFALLDSGAADDSIVTHMSAVHGKCAVEARKMEGIVRHMIQLSVDNEEMVGELWLAKNAVHSYALTNEMAKDLLKSWRHSHNTR